MSGTGPGARLAARHALRRVVAAHLACGRRAWWSSWWCCTSSSPAALRVALRSATWRRVRAFPGGRARLGRGPLWWLSWQHFRTFGRWLSTGRDLERLARRVSKWPSPTARCCSTWSRLAAARFCSAHTSAVLTCCAHWRRARGARCTWCMYQAVAPNLAPYCRSIDPALEAQVIQHDPDDPRSVLDLQRHIDAGKWVAILADRKELASARCVGRASLLGAPIELPQSPLLLAAVLVAQSSSSQGYGRAVRATRS